MRRRRSPRHQEGFSLVEALIASALLLIVAVGILPLFIRSVANNSMGGELSQKAAQAGSRLEEMLPNDINNALLRWGSTTDLTTLNYYTLGVNRNGDIGTTADRGWAGEGWVPTPARGEILWRRTTRIRAFNITEWDKAAINDDGELPPSFPPSPMPGSADPTTQSFKEITVTIQNNGTRLDSMSGFNTTVFTYVKSY